ncbi:upf0679 protein, partial [Chrysochromulina tobinii]
MSNLPASSEFYLQVQQRFWPQANMLCCVWFALGLRQVVSALRRAPSVLPPWAPMLPRWASPLPMPLATAALLFVHASHHYDASDMSRTVIFRDYGLEMLRGIPDKPRVLLLTLGDEVLNAARYVHRQLGVLNAARYVHRQLGVRPQLTILDQNYVQFDWFVRRIRGKGEYAQLELPGVSYGTAKGAFLIRQLIDANYDGWSIFVAGGMHTADSSWQPIEGYPQLGGYRLWPLGMVMQILRVESRINLDKWASKSEKLLPRLEWPKPPPVGSWEEVLAKNHYLAAYTNRPYYPLQYAYEALPERGGSAAEARDRFLLAARLHEASHDLTLNGSRALPDYFFRNWGVAYSQLLATERSDEGVAALKQRAMNAFLKYLAFSTLTEED